MSNYVNPTHAARQIYKNVDANRSNSYKILNSTSCQLEEEK